VRGILVGNEFKQQILGVLWKRYQ